MPPLKRLTGAAIRAVIDRQGSGASYATLARATGHSRAEVQKLCEAQGIFLRVSSTQGGLRRPRTARRSSVRRRSWAG